MKAQSDLELLSDETLINRFKEQGGNRYFAEIARRHGRSIHTACNSILHDPSLAEDLTQETFQRAFTKIDHFQAGNFRGWLYTIARNLCINHLRSSIHVEVASIENADLLPSSRDQERELLNADEVLAVLKDLPSKQRVCLKLCYAEGLSHREIAAATGWSEAEVRSHLQNGRRQFKIIWDKRK